jgi:hypothetical protein
MTPPPGMYMGFKTKEGLEQDRLRLKNDRPIRTPVLLAAAPKRRAAGVRTPAAHSPPLLDPKIDLYAFGARGPEPEYLKK